MPARSHMFRLKYLSISRFITQWFFKIYPVQKTINLAIYNSNGQKIRVIYQGVATIDSFEIKWDGRSDEGKSVVSGIYVVVVRVQDRLKMRKIILLR
jgi:hypothetical protein